MNNKKILVLILTIVVFASCTKTHRIVLITDANKEIVWDSSIFTGLITDNISKTVKDKVVYEEAKTTVNNEKIISNPEKIANELDIKKGDPNYYILTIKPVEFDKENNLKYEALFINGNRKNNEVMLLEDNHIDPKKIIDYIVNDFLKQDTFGIVYFKNVPEIKEVKEVVEELPDLKVDHTIFKYITFNEINNLNGYYGMITKIDGIFSKPELKKDTFMNIGSFKPELNTNISTIVKKINDSEAIGLFFNVKERTAKNFHFAIVEYITTGEVQIRLMIGPVDNIDFNELKKILNSIGIKVYDRKIHPLELL